jgi:hypothetical protein
LVTLSELLDISVGHVQFLELFDALRRRKLTVDSLHEAVASVRISVPLSDYLDFKNNCTKVYLFLSTTVNEAVKDNSFSTVFRANAVSNGASAYVNAAVFQVKFDRVVCFKCTSGGCDGGVPSPPTSQPTAVPTTRVPTAQPTAVPTTRVPSVQPTAIPTTRVPSAQPTAVPTTQVPSVHPTQLPSSQPSSTPTLSVKTIYDQVLSFQVDLRLTNVDKSTFDEVSYDVLREALSKITGIPVSHYGHGTLVELFLSRRLKETIAIAEAEEARRRLANHYNNTFVITFPVWAALADYVQYQGNTTKLYHDITTNLQKDVLSGGFVASIHEIALALNATQLIQTEMKVMHFVNFQVFNQTDNPTVQPSGSPNAVQSSIPTRQPSGSPHAVQSSIPTRQPSGFPHAVHSSFPTSFPTSVPSMFPTTAPNNGGRGGSDGGDGSGSNDKLMLEFHAYFDLFNISNKELSAGAVQAFLETITGITDIPESKLFYLGLLNEIGPDALGGGVGIPQRKLTVKKLEGDEYYNMISDILFAVPLDQYPQFRGNTKGLFDYITNLMKTSINNKGMEAGVRQKSLFVQSLHLNSENWGKELKWLDVFQVRFSNYISSEVVVDSHSPTFKPTASSHLDTDNSEADSVSFDMTFGISHVGSTEFNSMLNKLYWSLYLNC